MTEKDILEKAEHPFLIGLEYVIHTADRLYFLMRFARGGELFTLLRGERRFQENRAKFYVYLICLALGHLHD